MITRILIDKDGNQYYQKDAKKVATHFGEMSAEAINNAMDGDTILSNTHEKLTVLTPTWLDHYKRLTRGPQIMLLKDLGVIAAETGMGADSIVGDAGTGSGAAACYFARHVKHVMSFDVVPEHTAIGQKNADELGITNATFMTHDVYTSIPPAVVDGEERSYDVFVLDNPEPWLALAHMNVLKIGGYVVGYMPSINQTAEFARALQEHPQFQYARTVELMERVWAIKGMRVRPSSDSIGHTGFLVFARKIR
jgi:tRNA (adenine57-N1/adenine58-N1)-methyltransferase